MVYSTRLFVLCLTLCYFVIVFFVSPFSIAITSLMEGRANLSAFCTFVRFALVCFCLFSLPLGVWEGLRFVIVALPGLSLTLLFYTMWKGQYFQSVCQSRQNGTCAHSQKVSKYSEILRVNHPLF